MTQATWLTDGERTLWSGRPDWPMEKPRWRYWRRRFVTLLIALALFAGAIAALLSGQAAVAIVAGIFGALAAFAGLAASAEELRRRDMAYFITDRRVVVIRKDGAERYSALLPAITGFEARANGAATDLTIRTGGGEADFVTLFALADARAVEHILSTRLRGAAS